MPERPSRWSRRQVSLVVVALLAGCATEPTGDGTPGTPEQVDITDDRQPHRIELAVTDASDLDALARAEVVFQGPLTDADGASYITVFTTGAHAASMARYGLAIRGLAPPVSAPIEPASDDPDHADYTSALLSCVPDESCPIPAGSHYFISYKDIVNELLTMAAGTLTISTGSIGETFGDAETGGDKQVIAAIKFSPTEAPSNAPTIFILGTHHAREWLGTAVTLQLTRWLEEIKRAGTIDGVPDPTLVHDLAYATVVVVPVANPDGYERTRNGQRSWRGNTNTNGGACPGGVDLNRNHSVGWDPGSEATSNCGGFDTTFRGPSKGSEPETQAIEKLLAGDIFPGTDHPVALISYHSYGDLVVYPEGYKPDSSNGPRCEASSGDNCFNADFLVLRDVFGDTHSDLFVDTVSDPAGPHKFYRDHGRTILYPASGEVGLQAMYGPAPMLAISPELPSSCYNFFPECAPDPDAVVRGAALDQLNVLRRVLANAPALASTNVATAYAPNAIGTLSSGLWTREYRAEGLGAETARATFVKAVFLPESTGSLKAKIDGVIKTFKRARQAAQYEMFTLSMEDAGLDPECLPCEIVSTTDGEAGDGALECDGCIKLCDPERLPTTGWELKEGDRGGKHDCWWRPFKEDGVLVVPGGPKPFSNTSHCHMTFSAQWGNLEQDKIQVERQTATGWEPVLAMAYAKPYFWLRYPTTVVSYAFEANNFLASGQVPSFRFRVAGTPPPDSEAVKIFDPVIYCRRGYLPE